MIRYVITEFPNGKGVNLSREGDWGGLRFIDAATAREYARCDAGTNAYAIRQHTARRNRSD